MESINEAETDHFEEEWISKTQLKKEAEDLKKLGRKIIDLKMAQIDSLDLTETLYDAIILGRKLKTEKKLDALRRHVNYIGKILREYDMDYLNKRLDRVFNEHLYLAQYNNELEKIRDDLIKNGDNAVNLLIEKYNQFDRQKLRQLVRNANKEVQKEKLGKSYKDLFKYLKSIIKED